MFLTLTAPRSQHVEEASPLFLEDDEASCRRKGDETSSRFRRCKVSEQIILLDIHQLLYDKQVLESRFCFLAAWPREEQVAKILAETKNWRSVAWEKLCQLVTYDVAILV